MPSVLHKPKILIFVVAYEAERTIQKVLSRIPDVLRQYETEILVIDDGSHDKTYDAVKNMQSNADTPFPLHVLYNPVNQGYGGNQKIGFHYALQHGFDIVALVHGDGQYAPESLPELLAPLIRGEAGAVFGSRMLTMFGALKGGMPLYKYVGNRILTWLQNKLLKSDLSEFHSGYRLYGAAALRKIPFELNTNDFHFDTDIIIQLLLSGCTIKELPIPTYYGEEICRVNGMRYAWDVVKTTFAARIQKFGIFYERKFDLDAHDAHDRPYESKFNFDSTHTMAEQCIKPGSSVLDIGCASGYVSRALRDKKGCHVTGIEKYALPPEQMPDEFIQHDLNIPPFPTDIGKFDYVLLLDVIEHLQSPETFVAAMRAACTSSRKTVFIISTGNVAFLMTRIMLLMGRFNYGKRGILDLTHTRLFTFHSLKTLLEQGGFRIIRIQGVPAPFPLVFGNGIIAKLLLRLNHLCISVWPPFFAYQIFMTAEAMPTLELLLQDARSASTDRDTARGKTETPRTKAVRV